MISLSKGCIGLHFEVCVHLFGSGPRSMYVQDEFASPIYLI